MSSCLNVVLTGSSGRIAYSLIPFLCSGQTFGNDIEISLRLLDIQECQVKNEGVKMEIMDSGYELVREVIATHDTAVAFHNADVAILLGGFPRLKGMLRKDLIGKNVSIMEEQSKALNIHARKSVKVLVVANPANTNCLVASQLAPSIPAKNFTCLLRLDHDRLLGMLSAKLNEKNLGERFHAGKIRRVAVFGNHSATQVPHIEGGEVNINGEWKPLMEYIDQEWAEKVLPRTLQNRGADIIQHLNASSGQSAAVAISHHLKSWLGATELGTGEVFSMGIPSDGNPFGLPDGLIFSFPCTRDAGSPPGEYRVVRDGFDLSAAHMAALKVTIEELVDEKKSAESFLEK